MSGNLVYFLLCGHSLRFGVVKPCEGYLTFSLRHWMPGGATDLVPVDSRKGERQVNPARRRQDRKHWVAFTAGTSRAHDRHRTRRGKPFPAPSPVSHNTEKEKIVKVKCHSCFTEMMLQLHNTFDVDNAVYMHKLNAPVRLSAFNKE